MKKPEKLPRGKSVGRLLGVGFSKIPKARKKVKAILFVPKGRSIKGAGMDLQVVSIDGATFSSMAMRRC